MLVVFEGINGAGKSSIIQELVNYYKTVNVPVVVYKLPDRLGKSGQKIDLFLKGQIEIKSKYDILNMFATNRLGMRKNMIDDLRKGNLVLCDRYIFSAIAYQIPKQVTRDDVIYNYCSVIGHFDKKMPIPDVVYLIDGSHLDKRNRSVKEIFHYLSDTDTQMIKTKLTKVIRYYTNDFVIMKNVTNHLDQIVNCIIIDINTRASIKT